MWTAFQTLSEEPEVGSPIKKRGAVSSIIVVLRIRGSRRGAPRKVVVFH
jgi:hypothetical protein